MDKYAVVHPHNEILFIDFLNLQWGYVPTNPSYVENIINRKCINTPTEHHNLAYPNLNVLRTLVLANS